jgi:alkanesulfonate monooxygenase SsuD/methylene tetrahydromethanopterin reductase-like flavin-dependent oxidoreductase (luciferase family)
VEEFDEDDKVIIGNPDEVRRKMERYREAGLDHLLCFMAFGHLSQASILRSIELCGREVIPALAAPAPAVPV